MRMHKPSTHFSALTTRFPCLPREHSVNVPQDFPGLTGPDGRSLPPIERSVVYNAFIDFPWAGRSVCPPHTTRLLRPGVPLWDGASSHSWQLTKSKQSECPVQKQRLSLWGFYELRQLAVCTPGSLPSTGVRVLDDSKLSQQKLGHTLQLRAFKVPERD